jgi:hypothetical protein
MSVVVSFLLEKHIQNKMKIALPRTLPDVRIEDRATPPRFTIRVVIHGVDTWHVGATAPHVVENTPKVQYYASKFLDP